MRKNILISVTFLVLLSLSNYSNSSKCEESTGSEVFKAVHLINLRVETSEVELLKILNEFNEVIVELGYPNIKCQLWKERSDRQGKYKYIFESTWPSQEIYDKIHNSDIFKKTAKKYKKKYGEVITEDIYNRYISLN